MIVKRSKIGVSIILRESDPRSKYELFQRLNTGGSVLSAQEVRNCILVMINPDFYQWLRELADDPNFVEVTALTDRGLSEQYDMEIALRYLVFRRLQEEEVQNIGDVGNFVTEEMTKLATAAEFDRNSASTQFRETFNFLNTQLGPDACRRFDPGKKKFVGGFSVSAFEVVALGIGYWFPHHIIPASLKAKVQELWENTTFTTESGSGINASRRISRTIKLGRQLFKP